jgi:DNA repair protein RecO (recombination protein O)
MLTKDTAICIRATDYSETSQILTLFTRAAGKISVIAKGSKRPKSAFDGPVEVFSYGRIVFSDSTKEKLATLTEFEQQPGFADLANNLFALNCCLFGAELVNGLTHDYDPHPELFDGFLRFLQDAGKRRATNDERRDSLSLLILFQLTLLREIGLMPILNACANCKTSYAPLLSAKAEKGDGSLGTSHEFYFSSSANGLICKDCEASFPDKIKLTKNAANCLLVLSKPVLSTPALSNVEVVEGANAKLIAEAQEKTLNEIEKILVHHFTEILHRPPKMAKHILKN